MSNASNCIKNKLWLRDQASFHVNNRLANQELHHCPRRRVHSGTRREVGHEGGSSVWLSVTWDPREHESPDTCILDACISGPQLVPAGYGDPGPEPLGSRGNGGTDHFKVGTYL